MGKLDPAIVKKVTLGPHHVQTGRVRHYAGSLLGPPSSLSIVRYGPDEYNLVRFDGEGREMTDTFHETVDDAVEQARLEFLIRPDEWADTNDPY